MNSDELDFPAKYTDRETERRGGTGGIKNSLIDKQLLAGNTQEM